MDDEGWTARGWPMEAGTCREGLAEAGSRRGRAGGGWFEQGSGWVHGGLAEEIRLWVGNEDRVAGVAGDEFTVGGFMMEDYRFGEATGCDEGLGVAGIGHRRRHNDYKSVE